MVKFYGKSVAIFASSLLLMLTACSEKDLYDGGSDDDEDNNNPSLYDFSTTQNVKFNLIYNGISEGYAVPFNVYSENPITEDSEGNLILKDGIKPISGGISISGKYTLTKNLPAYVTDVYVYTSSLFVPSVMKATIQSGIANFETVNFSGTASRSSMPTTRTLANKMPDYVLMYEGGLYNGDVGPTSLNASNDLLFPTGAIGPNHEPRIDYHKDVPAGVYDKINAAFPEKQKATDEFRSGTSLYLEKSCEVWVSIIHTQNTQWDNTLGYFYHHGSSTADLLHEDRQNLTNKEIIAVPLAKLQATDSKLTLKSGDYVQLKYFNEDTQEWENEFPADLTIGWMLHPKSYDRVNRRLASSGWQWPLCSISTLNTDNHRIDCVVFNAGTEQEPFYCIGFEDNYKRNQSGADEDFNDVMFHIVTNPVDAIKPVPPIPDVEDVETTVTKKGMLAFEDNWPKKGDYDLNDVVVRYNSTATLICKAGETVTNLNKLEDTFSLIHNGGVHPNQFGYKVEIDPSYVQSITINDEAYTLVKDDFDGKNGFIIDLCDNIQNIKSLVRYDEANSTPMDYNIVIEFKDGVTESQWEAACAPYNPFITPKANTEVHLPRYSPTSRADMNLFGTEYDKSDVDKKIYYVSGENTNYPFALHLSEVETFKLPKEENNISTTYSQFELWVESNGSNYKDWYLK